jgi:hypothetical protein
MPDIDFLTWLVFAATGKVIIYLWQLFPFPPFMKMPYYIEKLHECDLCSGFWIYLALALFLKVDIFAQTFGVPPNIAGEFATAATTTYLVHIFTIGWREKFAEPIII